MSNSSNQCSSVSDPTRLRNVTNLVERKVFSATDVAIRRAANCLFAGELIGLPTETVYGLAARGDDAKAVERIFTAKKRPRSNPLILHTATASDAFGLFSEECSSNFQEQADRLSKFWPGPLTLIGPRSGAVLDHVTAGGDTVAVRVPDHPVALAVLRELSRIADCVVPVAAPSANRANYVSPTTAHHVAAGLGEHVAMILDGGPSRVGLESTIVLLKGDASPPRVLRSGAISPAQLSEAIGQPVEGVPPHPTDAPPVAAPGQFAKHYSPRTPLCLVKAGSPSAETSSGGGRVLRIVFGPVDERLSPNHGEIWSFNPDGKLESAAAELYAMLRRADALDFEQIQVDCCAEDGLGMAIMDRLRRASHR